MRSFLSLIAVLAVPAHLYGQPVFQRTFGGSAWDECFAVRQTRDSGYVMTGFTNSFGAGTEDIYLVKTSHSGSLLWSKTFGGSDGDRGRAILETSDGGFAIGGYTESFGAGLRDFCLVKTDDAGNLQWMKAYGTTGIEYLYDLKQTSDKGYIMTGWSGTAAGTYLSLVRVDSAGTMIWEKAFKANGNGTAAYGFSVLQTGDHGFFVTGEARGNSSKGFYYLRTDSLGAELWSGYSAAFGSSNSVNRAFSAVQTPDGGFIIAGDALDVGSGGYEIILYKLDSTGGEKWNRAYGGSGNDHGYMVQLTSDGGFVIAGSTESFGEGGSDLYVIRTDSSGTVKWSNTYGGVLDDNNPLEGNVSIGLCLGGGLVIAGSTRSFGAGSSDFYLVRTDSNGSSGCAEWPAPGNITTLSFFGNVGSTVSTLTPTTQPANINTGPAATLADILCSSVSVGTVEMTDNSVQVWPNPFSGQCYITTRTPLTNARLTVFDLTGRIILVKEGLSGNSVIIEGLDHHGLLLFSLVQYGEVLASGKLVAE